MTGFSWDYVAQSTHAALAELGRVTAATIAVAAEMGGVARPADALTSFEFRVR